MSARCNSNGLGSLPRKSELRNAAGYGMRFPGARSYFHCRVSIYGLRGDPLESRMNRFSKHVVVSVDQNVVSAMKEFMGKRAPDFKRARG